MSVTLATQARLVIPGVPPSPNARLGHYMQHYRIHAGLEGWKRLTWMLAHSARNEAHWPLPVRCDPPAPRWVRFDLHRMRLLDQDNAWASIKSVLDGLHWPGEHPSGMGPLLVDDSTAWCQVWAVEQHQAHLAAEERVVITVDLCDPRRCLAALREEKQGDA